MRIAKTTILMLLLMFWLRSYSQSLIVRVTTQMMVTAMTDKMPANMPPLEDVQSAKRVLACL